MHRFNMGNDNPVRNNKLLREAYQAGRRQALNEVSGGDFGGGGDPFGGGGGGGTRPAIEVDNSPIIDLDALGWIEAARAGQNVPNWVIEWFAQNASWLSDDLKRAMFMGRRSVNMGGLREQFNGGGYDPMLQFNRSGRSGRRRNRRATQRLRRRMMGEQFGGGGTPPTFQRAPMDPMAYGTGETRGGNRMGMGTGREGRQELAAAGQIGPVPDPRYPPGSGHPGSPRPCPAPTQQQGGRHVWDEGRGTWVYYGPDGLWGVYISPPGVWRRA